MASTLRSALILGGLFTACRPVVTPTAPLDAPPPSLWHPAPPPDDDAIYFVMVDRFANGDPTNDGPIDLDDPQAWHGGDLRGVINHLDDLQDLGIRTVWISPVFTSRHEDFKGWGAYHGYWTHDLQQVDPRFGDSASLRELSDALHDRGMRLLLDIVYNHVGYEAPLLTEHPEWFHTAPSIENWQDPVERVTGQVHGLPDLDQDQEPVYSYLRNATLQWIDSAQADGFRIDAVRHLPSSFLSRLGEDVRQAAGPDVTLLGEIFEGDPQLLAESWREGGFGSVFDFPLHYAMTDVFCRDHPLGRLGSILSLDRLHPDPSRLVTFLDNHDVSRIRSACGDDETRVQQALIFQLTTRGTPSITYGTETGLTGAEEPANRGDMHFDPDHPTRLLAREWLMKRRENPALRADRGAVQLLDDRLMVTARVASEQAALIAVNRHSSLTVLEIPEWFQRGTLATLGDSGALVEGRWELPPHSVSVLTATGREGSFDKRRQHLEMWNVYLRGVIIEAALPPGDGRWMITGSGPELGNWDPLQGIPFEEGSARFGYPIQGIVEYKLVYLDADGQAHWEDHPNRYILVRPAERDLTVRLREPPTTLAP